MIVPMFKIINLAQQNNCGLKSHSNSELTIAC